MYPTLLSPLEYIFDWTDQEYSEEYSDQEREGFTEVQKLVWRFIFLYIILK